MTTGPPSPPPPGPPGQPQQVRPQATPFSWTYGDLRDAAQQLVGKVLRLDTVIGPVFLFFGTDELGHFAAATEEALADCRGGLVVATDLPSGLPPDFRAGNGNRRGP